VLLSRLREPLENSRRRGMLVYPSTHVIAMLCRASSAPIPGRAAGRQRTQELRTSLISICRNSRAFRTSSLLSRSRLACSLARRSCTAFRLAGLPENSSGSARGRFLVLGFISAVVATRIGAKELMKSFHPAKPASAALFAARACTYLHLNVNVSNSFCPAQGETKIRS